MCTRSMRTSAHDAFIHSSTVVCANYGWVKWDWRVVVVINGYPLSQWCCWTTVKETQLTLPDKGKVFTFWKKRVGCEEQWHFAVCTVGLGDIFIFCDTVMWLYIIYSLFGFFVHLPVLFSKSYLNKSWFTFHFLSFQPHSLCTPVFHLFICVFKSVFFPHALSVCLFCSDFSCSSRLFPDPVYSCF